MTSWLDLPFEIKSQILDLYLQGCVSLQDLWHWSYRRFELHDTHVCARSLVFQIQNVLQVASSMQAEVLRLARTSRDKHAAAYNKAKSTFTHVLLLDLMGYNCLMTSLNALVHELEVGENLELSPT